MITIQGKGVSTGVAVGPLYFYQRAKTTLRRYEVADVEAEWARFKAAQAKAIEQLGVLAEKAREEAERFIFTPVDPVVSARNAKKRNKKK